jgi:hypothetical protein
MQIEVVRSTDEELEATGYGELLSLRVTIEEAQILRAMVGSFKDDISILEHWREELEYAGVERVDLKVSALAHEPVLFFTTSEE